MKSVIALLVTAAPLVSLAALDISIPHGQETLTFETPRGKQEICVIPRHPESANYSNDDLEEEKTLCSYDFYGLTRNREVEQMALCPKQNSTNPGVLVMDIPEGWTREKFETNKCVGQNDLQKTRAKFKQSVTCSYTPSILGYYQISRMLDNAGRVPVAVLRTMTKERHKSITVEGLAATKRMGGLIHKGWDLLEDAHDAHGTNTHLFDSSREFVYGALQENIKNEGIYVEMIGGGSYESRMKNFLKLPAYQHLASNYPITQVLRSNEFAKLAQPLETLKDVSDMILLDTIMTQQDRMGNQHYKWAWKWVDQERSEVKTKFVKTKMDKAGNLTFKSDEEKAEQQKYAAKGAVLVKEMILKDNDCGVRANFYSNKMKEVKALDGIHHISGYTYTALLKLAASLRVPEAQQVLKSETLMSDLDAKQMLNNLFSAEAMLKQKCHAGQLKLDLDLESYFTSQTPQFKCDI